ncbi:MAG: hypothetical protein AAGB46_08350, partial [Verrucomicrobiota bacterium]
MTNGSKPNLLNNWMGGYTPNQGYYDEYLDSKGNERSHWQRVSQKIGSLDQEAWSRREKQLERLIHANGITYNVY